MGLFDIVHIEAPLPDGLVVTGELQTKSFDDPCMTHYTIDREGRLWFDPVAYVPEEERRYYGTEKWGDEDSVWRMVGIMRRAPELREEVKDFHGDIDICDEKGQRFVVRFTNGRLDFVRPTAQEDTE